jgi:hypothetical protein
MASLVSFEHPRRVHHVNHILSARIYCEVAGCLCADRANLLVLDTSLETMLSSPRPQPMAKAPSRPSGPSDTGKPQGAQRQTMAEVTRMQRNLRYVCLALVLYYPSSLSLALGDNRGCGLPKRLGKVHNRIELTEGCGRPARTAG